MEVLTLERIPPMKTHHFIIPAGVFGSDTIAVDDPGIVHQIRKVLKLQVGEQVAVSNGAGVKARCLIAKIDKERVDLQVLEKQTVAADTARQVTLYCSLLKGDHFEWAVQKATEAGVSRIVPLITERVIKTGWAQFRLEKIIKEAAEQCGRAILPALESPLALSEAFQDANSNDLNIFFDISDKIFDKKILAKNIKTIGLFIGPEGGWSDSERVAAKQADVVAVSLGGLVLRAETAATVASWLAVNM